jgi:hypothetical protein
MEDSGSSADADTHRETASPVVVSDLLEALKEAREWVESTALACGYVGCTPENCASRRAEQSLALIDAAIAKAA